MHTRLLETITLYVSTSKKKGWLFQIKLAPNLLLNYQVRHV
jgi:hypothetical protein